MSLGCSSVLFFKFLQVSSMHFFGNSLRATLDGNFFFVLFFLLNTVFIVLKVLFAKVILRWVWSFVQEFEWLVILCL